MNINYGKIINYEFLKCCDINIIGNKIELTIRHYKPELSTRDNSDRKLLFKDIEYEMIICKSIIATYSNEMDELIKIILKSAYDNLCQLTIINNIDLFYRFEANQPTMFTKKTYLSHIQKNELLYTRQNKNKPKITLVPSKIIEQVAQVLTDGENKYPGNDGFQYLLLKAGEEKLFLDSTLRHIYSYLQGKSIDKESGHKHLIHAITNLIMLENWENNHVK